VQWRNSAGQAAVEAAVLIPLVALVLLAVVSAGMGAVAELLVVSSAGQGARHAAALCVPGGPPSGALDSAEQTALNGLRPLSGPKQVTPATTSRM
jgi:Flp pilus assembly pilin Flp